MTAMIAPSQASERAALRAGLDDFVATRLYFLGFFRARPAVRDSRAHRSGPTGTGDQANDYLSMIRNDAKLAERIILDPSGFSLVGETVKKVEDVLISNKKFIREYFAAGAALTRDIYKKVYEFAAPLYPEK